MAQTPTRAQYNIKRIWKYIIYWDACAVRGGSGSRQILPLNVTDTKDLFYYKISDVLFVFVMRFSDFFRLLL